MIAFYLQVVEFILASHWLWTFFAIHVWLMFRLDTFKIAPEYSYVDVIVLTSLNGGLQRYCSSLVNVFCAK